MNFVKKRVLLLAFVASGLISLAQSAVSINEGFFYFTTHNPAYNEIGVNYCYRSDKPRGLSLMADYACAFLPRSNYYNKISGLIGYSSDMHKLVAARILLGGGLMNTTREYDPLLNNNNPKYLKIIIGGLSFRLTQQFRLGVDLSMQTAYEKNKDTVFTGHNYRSEYHWYSFDMSTIKLSVTYLFGSGQ